MSVENTSHAGGPRTNELVPSRYARRVGPLGVLTGVGLGCRTRPPRFEGTVSYQATPETHGCLDFDER
jgi:hypothetical protein